MKELKCPTCGAGLKYDEGIKRDFMFCEFCGTKVSISDQYITNHIIDEADIKRAETERIVKLKEVEAKNEREKIQLNLKELQKNKYLIMIFGIVMFVVGIIFLITKEESLKIAGWILFGVGICFGLYPISDGVNTYGKLSLPDKYSLLGKNYNDAVSTFKAYGYTNIYLSKLCDLNSIDLFKRNNTVKDVTINNESIYSLKGDEKFDKTTKVVVIYHSVKPNK